MTSKVPRTSFLILFSLFLSLVLCCFIITLSEAQEVPAIYVWGDSTVDVGNNNYLTLSIAKANYPHNGIDFPGQEPTGRFSNGKIFADFLAEKVGLVTSPPYLSFVSNDKSNGGFPITGVSFASGSSGILNSTDTFSFGANVTDLRFRQSIPLSKQVEFYTSTVYGDLVQQLGSSGAQDHLSKSIFLVATGNNDLLAYFGRGSTLPIRTTLQQYIDSMLSALKQALKTIHDFGGRKYVVVGGGPIGCCPASRNDNYGECNEEANEGAIRYNEGLKSMLQGLQSELQQGILYSFIDEYGVLDVILRSPSTFGFREIKAACCGLGNLNAQVPCLPISSYCSNRSDHLFWDFYHPTEATVRIFFDTVFDGSQQYTVPMNIKQLIAA